MGITVAVKVEHLALPKTLLGTPSEHPGIVLVPNVETSGSVRATVKDFIRRNLFIPDDLQVLQAPLFRKLNEKDSVEEIYKRYACQAEIENPELHLDEDNFVFFAREGVRSVDLDDNVRLDEYHILDKALLQLRRLPQSLSEQGGRIFVETKDGILPILGVNPVSRVIDLKHALETMTGVPVDQQLLSSVGRVMHNDFCLKDFDGPHRVCEDSTLDLCKSGDSNADQAHLRMVISVSVMGEQSFTMVVQGRDHVQSVQQVVEARTGVATWQQRITYSGKMLQEKKTLSDYFIHQDSTLQVTVFRSPCKPPPKVVNVIHSSENSGVEEQKPAARKIKLLRTSKGHIVGNLTIPVLTTDTVSDLRRKVRRTLQPLTERNFVVLRSPAGVDSPSAEKACTPSKTIASPSKGDQLSSSGRRLSRVLSFTGRTFSGPLSSSSSNTTSPASKATPTHQSAAEKVVRALSFRSFSGTLGSPSKQPPPPSRPAPPLVPNASLTEHCNDVDSTTNLDIAFSGLLSSETKQTPIKVVVHDSSPSAASPMKFVPNGPPPTIIPRSKSHSRAQSMGHLSFTSSQLHALPEQLPLGNTLTHTAPISLDSSSASPSKNSRGRESPPAGSAEKRGLGAWLTDGMHLLKGHIKSPFVER